MYSNYQAMVGFYYETWSGVEVRYCAVEVRYCAVRASVLKSTQMQSGLRIKGMVCLMDIFQDLRGHVQTIFTSL